MEQNHNQSRYIPLAGAANVRDLGGCPLPGGGTTAWGRFLRADSTASLSLPFKGGSRGTVRKYCNV